MDSWGFAFARPPLKRFFNYLLKRSIGGLLKHDIDLEQVDVQLYKGFVQLKALELDVEQINVILASAGVHLLFVSGAINCLKMDVPWRNLLREHGKLYIHGLQLAITKVEAQAQCQEEELPDMAGSFQSAGSVTSMTGSARQEELPRYSEEGIGTLSRLVKQVLSRLEVCLDESSLSLFAPPARSKLCLQISSVVVFSEDLEEPDESGDSDAGDSTCQARTMRVGKTDLVLAPIADDDFDVCPETSSSQDGSASRRRIPGEILLASASPRVGTTGAAGFLQAKRRRRDEGGSHLDVRLDLHLLRFAVCPQPLGMLVEIASSLLHVAAPSSGSSVPFAASTDETPAVEGDPLQPGQLTGLSRGLSALPSVPSMGSLMHDQTPSMMQSLMASAKDGSDTHLWHELFNGYQSDAMLEDCAGGGTLVEDPEEDADEAEWGGEAQGASGTVEGQAPKKSPLTSITCGVNISRIGVLVVLQNGVGNDLKPADVFTTPKPTFRARGDQVQLCGSSWEFSFSRQLPRDGGTNVAPRAVTQFGHLSVHLHRRSGDGAPQESEEESPIAVTPEEVAVTPEEVVVTPEEVEEEEATPVPPSPSRDGPEEFLIHSLGASSHAQLQASGAAAAASSSDAFASAVFGAAATLRASQQQLQQQQPQMERSAMWASAVSQTAAAPSPLARIVSTPTLSSCSCSTHESVGVDSDDDDFPASSVHSMDSPRGNEAGTGPRQRGIDGEVAVAAAAAASSASHDSAPSGSAAVPAALDQAHDSGTEHQALADEAVAEALEVLFFDRSRPIELSLLTRQHLEMPVAPPEQLACGGWRQLQSGFRSKRMLAFLVLPASVRCEEGDRSGRLRDLRLPPVDHPLWENLRLLPGGRESLSSSCDRELRAEWSGASATDSSATSSIQVEVQPVLVSLCATSVSILRTALHGALRFRETMEQPQQPQQSWGPAGATPASFGLICISPVLRVELALGESEEEQEEDEEEIDKVGATEGPCLVASFIAPRVHTLPRADHVQLVCEETLRAEVDDIALDFHHVRDDQSGSELFDSASFQVQHRVLTLHARAQEEGCDQGCLASFSVFRRLRHRPRVSSEPPLAEKQQDTQEATFDSAGLSEWTKISAPPMKSEGRTSRGSMVLQDLRQASRRLLRPSDTSHERKPRGPVGPAAGRPRSGTATASTASAAAPDGDGDAGIFSSMACEARIELEAEVFGEVRLHFDLATLVALRGALQSFARQFEGQTSANVGAGRAEPGVAAPSCTDELEFAPLACSFKTSHLRLDVLEPSEGEDPSKRRHDVVSNREDFYAACSKLFKLELGRVCGRFVQSVPSSFQICALGQYLSLETSPPGHRDICEQLLRPWFSPLLPPVVQSSRASRAAPSQRVDEVFPAPYTPWQRRRPRWDPELVPAVLTTTDAEEWRDRNALLVCFGRNLDCGVVNASVNVKLSRLTFNLYPGLLDSYSAWASKFSAFAGSWTQLDIPVPEGAEEVRYTVRLSYLDCLVDIPSEAYRASCPTLEPVRSQAAVEQPSPPAFAGDADKWRLVAHLSGSVGLTIPTGVSFRAQVRECSLFVVDHPSHLATPNALLSSSPDAVVCLTQAGFAHVLGVTNASGVWKAPSAAGQETSVARSLEVSIGTISGHLCADAARCLICLGTELVEVVQQMVQTGFLGGARVDDDDVVPPTATAPVAQMRDAIRHVDSTPPRRVGDVGLELVVETSPAARPPPVDTMPSSGARALPRGAVESLPPPLPPPLDTHPDLLPPPPPPDAQPPCATEWAPQPESTSTPSSPSSSLPPPLHTYSAAVPPPPPPPASEAQPICATQLSPPPLPPLDTHFASAPPPPPPRDDAQQSDSETQLVPPPTHTFQATPPPAPPPCPSQEVGLSTLIVDDFVDGRGGIRPAQPSALLPSSPQGEAGMGELASCLIDDYIHAQEQHQQLRSPILAAQPDPEAPEPPTDSIELDIPEPVQLVRESSAVAVCLLDPEAYPEGELREMVLEDESVRRELNELYSDVPRGVQQKATGSSAAAVSTEAERPAVPKKELQQDGSIAVWFVNPAEVQVVHDYFSGEVRPLRRERKASERWHTPPLQLSLSFRCDDVQLSIYGGEDFEDEVLGHLQARAAGGSEPSSASRPSRRRHGSHLTLQLQEVRADFRTYVAESLPVVGPGAKLDTALTRQLHVAAKDFRILDHVQHSVYSHLLAYFEDDVRRPRPKHVDMLCLHIDELKQLPRASSSEVHVVGGVPDTLEYRVDVRLLPLRLTVDQDVVHFLLDFVQLCTLQTFVEEEQDEGDFGQPAFDEERGMMSAFGGTGGAASSAVSAETTTAAADVAAPAATSTDFRSFVAARSSRDDGNGSSVADRGRHGAVASSQEAVGLPFFRSFSVGAVLVSVDYKAKRLDVDALRRGELWELVNLLPLLEGLQIAFRKVSLTGISGLSQVTTEVVRAWSGDLNRTQILRSLTGVTPIRSFANIGGGFAQMVLEPLKAYRTGGDSEKASRMLLRGLVSFLRNVTVESIDLTERIFVGTQSALEHVAGYMGDQSSTTSVASVQRQDAFSVVGVHSSGEVQTAAATEVPACDTWTPVERGAANFIQPDGTAEGLQQACTNLSRGVRHAGQAVVTRPLLEFQRGAPPGQVLRSVASGIPMCVLRPTIGATAAATSALQGVRNSVDPLHRREVAGKFKPPE